MFEIIIIVVIMILCLFNSLGSYAHARARTAVFPWTPNLQFILDITSDSKVFPSHHYELWISGERYINIICENFQIYDFYTFFSLCEWTLDSNQNEANMAAPR